MREQIQIMGAQPNDQPAYAARGIQLVSQPLEDARSAAEKARHTASIIGSLKHEGYVPTQEAEAVHQRVARGEITSEEAIAIFRERAIERERKGIVTDNGRNCD